MAYSQNNMAGVYEGYDVETMLMEVTPPEIPSINSFRRQDPVANVASPFHNQAQLTQRQNIDQHVHHTCPFQYYSAHHYNNNNVQYGNNFYSEITDVGQYAMTNMTVANRHIESQSRNMPFCRETEQFSAMDTKQTYTDLKAMELAQFDSAERFPETKNRLMTQNVMQNPVEKYPVNDMDAEKMSIHTEQFTAETRGLSENSRATPAMPSKMPQLTDLQDYEVRHPDCYKPREVCHMIVRLLRERWGTSISNPEIMNIVKDFYKINGYTLSRMNRDYFYRLDVFHGRQLFEDYQRFKISLQPPEKCNDFSPAYLEELDSLVAEESKTAPADNHTHHLYESPASQNESRKIRSQSGKSPIISGGNLPTFLAHSPKSEVNDSDSAYYTQAIVSDMEAVGISDASMYEEQSPMSNVPESPYSSSIAFSPSSNPSSCSDDAPSPGIKIKKSRSKSKKHQGRPRNVPGNHLWEFCLERLCKEHKNPITIKWEDRKTGIFRILESEQLATYWGHWGAKKKVNKTMNYEKLSGQPMTKGRLSNEPSIDTITVEVTGTGNYCGSCTFTRESDDILGAGFLIS